METGLLSDRALALCFNEQFYRRLPLYVAILL